ncbi:hypothetical protein [Catellatospora tritici]|uniref:hypothetical protein n=1 Tax=Catellatospora tritici TaxID=2851566 RepID=UPI001C2D6CAB|nr:hypothetical protein [Catellatospora tritici]MBV1855383.1 hypothetical protein [Catellatospora tritici]
MRPRLLVSLFTVVTVVPALTIAAVTTAVAHARSPQAGGTLTARVFATREGLVGWQTANGHAITNRDWFAALPSWRGLSDKGEGDRSVRVCHEGNNRCVFLPVWDVGPWNTMDDYWAEERHSWDDLPRGKPEAQAAYEDGYHKGKDESGRKVSNPAGIDIADGAFWDGLGLDRNDWVDVTFLWTGEGDRGTVDTPKGEPLRVRSGPRLGAALRGGAAEHAQVPIRCQVRGDKVDGTVRSTDLWDRVGEGIYVSHAYIEVDDDFKAHKC